MSRNYPFNSSRQSVLLYRLLFLTNMSPLACLSFAAQQWSEVFIFCWAHDKVLSFEQQPTITTSPFVPLYFLRKPSPLEYSFAPQRWSEVCSPQRMPKNCEHFTTETDKYSCRSYLPSNFSMQPRSSYPKIRPTRYRHVVIAYLRWKRTSTYRIPIIARIWPQFTFIRGERVLLLVTNMINGRHQLQAYRCTTGSWILDSFAVLMLALVAGTASWPCSDANQDVG